MLESVLLEFEIGSKLLRIVIATKTGTHDELICLPDQRQFGSFKFFLHSTHLLSIFSFQMLLLYATCSAIPARLASARLRNHNSSRTMFRNWCSLQSSPAQR